MAHRTDKLPLKHVRAIVLTQAWSGAFATRLLADMGAEVIQVEALSRPDPWRGGYPPRLFGTYPNNDPGARPYNRNAAFNSVNTGKKAITLDLNYESAIEVFLQLVSMSDIVAENFSSRVLPNLGLDYPVLREVNPSVILLRMSSYGYEGPYSTYMGNGATTEPMAGISSLLGYAGGPPMNSGIMHTDAFGGLMGMASLLLALYHRSWTGLGQFIDLSHQESSIGLIASEVIEFTMNGKIPDRRGNFSDTMSPHNNYPCSGEDAWVAIAVRSNDEWARLCEIMSKPGLANQPRFLDLQGRQRNTEELDIIIAEWTKDRNAHEIAALLQDNNIPSAPVLKAHELLDNPQLRARKFFQTLPHSETGRYSHAGVPWKMSKTPGGLGGPAPCLGQHTKEVLEGLLGMPRKAVQTLVDMGITGDSPNLRRS